MKRNGLLCVLICGLLLLGGCAQQQRQLENIGLEEAKTLALQEAKLTAADVTFTDTSAQNRDGMDYYRVAFTAQETLYTYDIDALTGVVIAGQIGATGADSAKQTDPSAGQTDTPSGDMISQEEAKAKALAHAGLTVDQVNFVRSQLDREDGRQVYDVEFYTKDGKEYDYEIDAKTGEVRSYDYDADHYTPDAAAGQSISADQAKKIALAQIAGAGTQHIKVFETDYDDGRLVYEGTIIYDNREYDFEIDGYSGAIQSWESEPLGH